MENIREYIKGIGDELEQEITRICQIPAPTFSEEERARYILKRLREEGIDNTCRDESGNILGKIDFQRTGRSILLAAHMDTVFDKDVDVTVRRKGDRLLAPGIGDNSSNVAGLIYLSMVAARFSESFSGTLYLAFTVGEEALGDLMGMKRVMERYRDSIDLVIVVDGHACSIQGYRVGIAITEINFKITVGNVLQKYCYRRQ